MSEMHFTQEACGAENGPSERGPAGVPRTIAEQTRAKKRGVAKASTTTKADAAPSKDRLQQSAAPEVIRRSSGHHKTAQPSEADGTGSAEVVVSVAELAMVISRDPENRKKRLKLAEALRECGFDERKVAEFLYALAEKLSRNNEAGAGGLAAGKLLLEVLKEVTHSHEPQKTTGNSDSSDLPPIVRLIHNVPRPVRTE
jgi:hypothetical protein